MESKSDLNDLARPKIFSIMKRQTIALIAVIAAIGAATVPLVQSAEAQSTVPDWIKTNAGWWAEGTVDDANFSKWH